MMISTRGRYALRVMIDLAEHRGQGFVPLKAGKKFRKNIWKASLPFFLKRGLWKVCMARVVVTDFATRQRITVLGIFCGLRRAALLRLPV